MNKKITLLFIMLLFAGNGIFAQNNCNSQRYINDLFEAQFSANQSTYGTADALVYPTYVSEAATYSRDLQFDFYEPEGDTLSKRPLIVMAFGGAFLLGGSTLPPALPDFCRAMARKGFCVASIDYRIGMNPLDEGSAIRAVYRGAQDMKAAIRFFRHNAAIYRLDPNNIFSGGNSAGGINAIHAAYVLVEDVAPGTIFDPIFYQDRPFPLADWPDLGCPDCSGNSFPVSSIPQAVINLWGAIGDINWIGQREAPIISFHGSDDFIVCPNTCAPFNVDAFFPELAGSIPITAQANAVGISNEMHILEGAGHEAWINSTTALFIQQESADFLYNLMKPNPPSLLGSLEACENIATGFCINPNQGSTYCWSVTGGQIIGNTGDCITIIWDTDTPLGTVEVIENNCLDIASDPTSLNVNIDPAPLADFTFNYVDSDVDFTPIEQQTFSYSWDFGDGTNSTEINPTHTFQENGVYNVTLIVNSLDGCTNSYTTTINQTCQPILIMQQPTLSGIYKAGQFVYSDQDVQANQSVVFVAGDSILLDAGFEVFSGSTFLGTILPCTNQ